MFINDALHAVTEIPLLIVLSCFLLEGPVPSEDRIPTPLVMRTTAAMEFIRRRSVISRWESRSI